MFLPPYSPDLNPIESVFGETKKYLRRHCYWTRTKQGVALSEQDVRSAFQNSMTARKLAAFVAHSGYRLVP